MVGRMNALALGVLCAIQIMAGPAWAQRPPQQGGQNKDFSFEKAVDWVLSRPGVMAAIVIILAVIIYYVVMQRRSKT